MRLGFAPPRGFARHDEAGRAESADGSATLEWSSLRMLPARQASWFGEVLFAGLPAGATLAERRRENGETERGWPLLLVESEVVGGSSVGEVRLAAFWAFLEHGAHALLRARDAAAFAAVADDVRAAMRAAAPDFTADPVAIAEFWDGVEAELEAEDRAASPIPLPAGPSVAGFDGDLATITIQAPDGTRPAALIRLETSAFSRARGVACLLSVRAFGRYRVVELFATPPSPAELEERVRAIVESLGPEL